MISLLPWLLRLRAPIVQSLREHRWLLGAILAHSIVLLAVAAPRALDGRISFDQYSAAFAIFPQGMVIAAIGRAVWILAAIRPADPGAYLVADLRRFLSLERVCMALPVLAAMPVFMSAFTSFKAIIPALAPFSWDPVLAQLDRALHGNQAPWEILQPLLGHPLVTSGLNFLYNGWLFLMCAVLLWQTFSLADRPLRMRFLLSFVLVWALLGNGLALLLSSAGPCFYGAVTHLPDPYAGLMAYLHQARESYPVWSLGVQEALWSAYASHDPDVPIRGISAMPSMHAASTVLFWLLVRDRSRWVRRAFGAFAIAILLGAVHLGWHYAIDGYVGAAGAWAIWWAVGRALGLSLAPQAGFRHRGKLAAA